MDTDEKQINTDKFIMVYVSIYIACNVKEI